MKWVVRVYTDWIWVGRIGYWIDTQSNALVGLSDCGCVFFLFPYCLVKHIGISIKYWSKKKKYKIQWSKIKV